MDYDEERPRRAASRPSAKSRKRPQTSATFDWRLPAFIGAAACIGIVAVIGIANGWFGGGSAATGQASNALAPFDANVNASSPAPATPVVARPAGPVNPLLKSAQQVHGAWTIENDRVTSPGDPGAVLQLSEPPAPEFVIALKIKRLSGDNTFAIGVPVGEQKVLVALDAHAGNFSGLEYLDGRNVSENEATRRGRVLMREREVTVECTIRNRSITCVCDGVKIIDWRGHSRRLSLPGGFAVPN